MKKCSKRAFTLVELLVAITVITILGTIAFISLQGYNSDARDARKLSDIDNLKKSLELFYAETGKYPKPDSGVDISYDNDLVWIQGIVGNNVAVNLSPTLPKKPLDPLTEKEYTYSVTNNYKEYELLAIYESNSITYNKLLSNTNASNYYVKVDGTYNGVFVKTKKYFIPTPSIITSETLPLDFKAEPIKLQSQIISGGKNIISYGKTEAFTGGLTGITLNAFTGTLSLLNDNNKVELAKNIILTYSGSIISQNSKYKEIVNTNFDDNDDLIALVDVYVFKKIPKTKIVVTIPEVNPYENCTSTGQILTATSTYPGCDTADIIQCAGVGTGLTLAACNLGSTIAGTNVESYGKYFQWGNNSPMDETTPTSTTRVDASSYGPGNYYNNNLMIIDSLDWSTVVNDNLWGEVTNTNVARQGPCADGYHIPSQLEFNKILFNTPGYNGFNSTANNLIINNFKFPKTGSRGYSGIMSDVGFMGKYKTSNPNSSLVTNSGMIAFFQGDRASAYSVRCFKN